MMLHIWEVHRPFRSPPDFTKRFDRSGYEDALAATDEWLAPVYEAAGEDTLFVITGDHGEEYPDTPLEQKINRVARVARRKLKPSRWWPWLDKKFSAMAVGHGFALYEHLVRVPLIMAGPGVPVVEVQDQVRHVDLLPTLADICGLEKPSNIDGRSVRPLMDGGSLPEEPAYMEAVGVKLEGKRILGARTPEWKLLKPGGGKPALHKIDGSPPDEKKNLYNRYPEVATHLEAFIQRVQEAAVDESSGMTADEEAIVEQQLRDLGYL
jgi:arylsulfatase A-like enzyme